MMRGWNGHKVAHERELLDWKGKAAYGLQVSVYVLAVADAEESERRRVKSIEEAVVANAYTPDVYLSNSEFLRVE